MFDFSLTLPKKHLNDLIDQLKSKYLESKDPYGLNLMFTKKMVTLLYPFYKHYFKLRVKGKHHVADRPYIIVSNHSGQLAFDGALISMAMALEFNPPRIVRPMVERFVPNLPFLGEWLTACGAVLGDRENALRLLKNKETILVFPEGVAGIAKDTKDFYQLQKFTKGFLRIALESGVDILPVAVIGAEECYPYVYHSKKLAKLFKLPTFPITPTFPFLGPLGIFPLPSPIDIQIGKPIQVPSKATEVELEDLLYKIERDISSMIRWGLQDRRSFSSAYLGRSKKRERKPDVIG